MLAVKKMDPKSSSYWRRGRLKRRKRENGEKKFLLKMRLNAVGFEWIGVQVNWRRAHAKNDVCNLDQIPTLCLEHQRPGHREQLPWWPWPVGRE